MALGLSASPPAVLLLLSLLGLAAAGKLLVVPMDGSHWLSMREVLDMLQQKGHEVVVVAPEVSMHIKPSKNFVMKMFSVPFTKEEMEKDFKAFFHGSFEEGTFFERFFHVLEGIKRITNFGVTSCEKLLQNKELIRYLEESKFDAILTDPFVPCGVILAEHLSLPAVYFLRGIPCGLDFEATQCPKPPSYVPRGFTGLTDRMTFLQRVKNLLFDTQNLFLCDFAFDQFSKLASEFLQREVTVLDLLRKGSVWLLRLDFVLDYPRPLMPNIIPIGGVNCAHKELPQLFLLALKWFSVEGKHQGLLVKVCDGLLMPPAKRLSEFVDSKTKCSVPLRTSSNGMSQRLLKTLSWLQMPALMPGADLI
ncbi:UDP-glucuronosyltransferase 1A1-like [Melozone crissalis]|uniref:UDP-glucuronosyltransferase 1A1-like n=1 Tax=Melozone crissalis TaxID=40204 RepID=UPI0023DB349E|nr:UDP-glucuronosyltransferase 1A1-like [Melozone crissalis]